MAQLVEVTAGEGWFAGEVMRRPDLFSFFAEIHASAGALGADLPQLRRPIQHLVDHDMVDLLDGDPWHRADVRYQLDVGRIRHRMPAMGTLYRATAAYRMPPIPQLPAYSAYEIAHIFFYLSDFGRRSVRPMLGERFEATREYVRLLLGTYLFQGAWDLVGELIVCCACLDRFHPPLLEAAWRGLLAARRPQHLFKANYHLNIVTLVAAAVQCSVARGA